MRNVRCRQPETDDQKDAIPDFLLKHGFPPGIANVAHLGLAAGQITFQDLVQIHSTDISPFDLRLSGQS